MEEKVTRREKLKIIATFEAGFLAMALVFPFTPSKTGDGTMDLAPYFIDDPSYLESVAVGFVIVNLLFLLLMWAGWLYCVFSDGCTASDADSNNSAAEK